MSKRQLVLDAFNNKPVERVPVGFWFHFVEGRHISQVLLNSIHTIMTCKIGESNTIGILEMRSLRIF